MMDSFFSYLPGHFLLTFLITSIVICYSGKLYEWLWRYLNRTRIYSLDATLMFSEKEHIINPFFVFLKTLICHFIACSSIFVLIGVIGYAAYNYLETGSWSFNYWWLLLLFLSFIAYLIPQWVDSRWRYKKNYLSLKKSFPFFGICGKERRNATKGLVGILSSSFSKVAPISRPKDLGINEINEDERNNAVVDLAASIKFATSGSYESRKPITDRDKIKLIHKARIDNYYKYIKDKICRECGADNDLFQINETGDGSSIHVCDYMLKVFSVDNICKAIKDLSDKVGNDNSIQFIGDKIGVWDYNIDKKGQLELKVYLTDHFTFHVFKKIFQSEAYKETIQDIIRRVNLATEKEKHYLIQCLKFVFSSFGVDVTISGYTTDDREAMLVSIRSKKIQREGESLLHVPVNEAFSLTDVGNGDDCFSLEKCVIRGIEEELGVPERVLDPEGDNKEKRAQISFFDFAIVSDRGEIGVGCHVDLTRVMPLEQIRLYPGQDKYMETEDVLIVPYPKFRWNFLDYTKLMYKSVIDDRLCYSWVSFSTMLYQRSIMRHSKVPAIFEITAEFLFATIAVFLSSLVIDGISAAENNTFIAIREAFGEICLIFAVYTIFALLFKPGKYRFSFLMPFLPQWNGDVKVIQATREITENSIAKWILFGLDNPSRQVSQECQLHDLRVYSEPYCGVRRELSNEEEKIRSTESPVSFYRMCSHMACASDPEHGNTYSKMEFRYIPYRVYYDVSEDKMDLCMDVIINNGKPSFRFTRPIPVELQFKQFTALNLNKTQDKRELLKYFNISSDEDYLYAELDVEKFLQLYRPLDLFFFKDTYYWSAMPKNLIIDNNNLTRFEVTKDTKPKQFYDDCLEAVISEGQKCAKSTCYTFVLTGNVNDMERFLSDFTQRVEDNRRRMNTLDIYMMQLAFIREWMENDNNFVFANTAPPTWRMRFGRKLLAGLVFLNDKSGLGRLFKLSLDDTAAWK